MRGHEPVPARRDAPLHLGSRQIRDRRDIVRRRAGAGVGPSPMLRRRRARIFGRNGQFHVQIRGVRPAHELRRLADAVREAAHDLCANQSVSRWTSRDLIYALHITNPSIIASEPAANSS